MPATITLDTIKKEIGSVFKLLRERENISQTELANNLNVTQNYISLLEKGKKTPSLKLLYDLASFINVPASSILKAAEDLSFNLALKDTMDFTMDAVDGFEKALDMAENIRSLEEKQ